MFEQESAIYASNLGLIKAMGAAIDQAHLARPVCEGGVTAGWVLGHLAVGSDFALTLLGGPSRLPDDWRKRFGTGSKPSTSLADYPTPQELLGAVESAHAALLAAIKAADPAVFSRPHGLPWFKDSPLRTIGDVVANLMTMHEGFHLGQLSVWRRQAGFEPMF